MRIRPLAADSRRVHDPRSRVERLRRPGPGHDRQRLGPASVTRADRPVSGCDGGRIGWRAGIGPHGGQRRDGALSVLRTCRQRSTTCRRSAQGCSSGVERPAGARDGRRATFGSTSTCRSQASSKAGERDGAPRRDWSRRPQTSATVIDSAAHPVVASHKRDFLQLAMLTPGSEFAVPGLGVVVARFVCDARQRRTRGVQQLPPRRRGQQRCIRQPFRRPAAGRQHHRNFKNSSPTATAPSTGAAPPAR